MTAKNITEWLTQARQENAKRGPDAEWVAEIDGPGYITSTGETWTDTGRVLWEVSDNHYVVTHDLTHEGDDWIVAEFDPQNVGDLDAYLATLDERFAL